MDEDKKKEVLDNLPKKQPNKDFIEIQDVGGISHYTYNVVRYKKYMYDDEVDLEQYGIHGKVIAPYKFEAPETDIKIKKNGKEILLSIYELACDINESIGKSYIEKIMAWCKDNFHPYDIDLLYEKYKKTLQKGEQRDYEPEVIDGTFEVNRFMKDIEYVYQAFTYIMAFQELLTGKGKSAFNLYKQGKYFDTLSFFEIYKGYKSNDSYDPNASLVSGKDLLKAMQEDKETIELDEEYEQLTPNKKLALFKKNALSHKEELYQNIISFFPDIPMHLTYNFKNKGVGITASIDSVFDICWYTMARMLTYYGLSDSDRVENRVYKDKQWYYDQGTYGTCLFCGKLFLKEGARQKYCKNNPECQKARKRKNASDFYKRSTQIKKK